MNELREMFNDLSDEEKEYFILCILLFRKGVEVFKRLKQEQNEIALDD